MTKKRRERNRGRRDPWVRTSTAVCEGKMAFGSQAAASKYVRRARFGNRLSPYVCSRCHRWHLTGGFKKA